VFRRLRIRELEQEVGAYAAKNDENDELRRKVEILEGMLEDVNKSKTQLEQVRIFCFGLHVTSK
jgi:hypothetical protein